MHYYLDYKDSVTEWFDERKHLTLDYYIVRHGPPYFVAIYLVYLPFS